MRVTELIEFLSSLPPDTEFTLLGATIVRLDNCPDCSAYIQLNPVTHELELKPYNCGDWQVALIDDEDNEIGHSYSSNGPIVCVGVPLRV